MTRLRLWLARTTSPRAVLVQHFLRRFFDTELTTTPGQALLLLVGVVVAVGVLSAMLPLQLYRKYVDISFFGNEALYLRASLADRLLFHTLTMVLAGLLTALEWHALFPDARDALVLGPLPVRARDVFAAKLGALLLLATLFAAVIAGPQSVLLPAVLKTPWQQPRVGLQWVLARGLASVSAFYFVFFTLVAVQGMAMNLLSARLFRSASLALQVGLLAALLAAFPAVFSVPRIVPYLAARPELAALLPPFWFLGLEEALLGHADLLGRGLASRALGALLAATAGALLLYAISYRRHTGRLLDAPRRSGRRRWLRLPAAWLLRRWMPSGPERAVFAFIGQTLTRSRQHKLLLGVYAGLGTALVLDSFVALITGSRFQGFGVRSPQLVQATLSVPLVLSFFLLSGMRYVFAIPVELRANWVFRLSEDDQRTQLLDAVEKALLAWGVLPVLVVTLPLEMLLLGTATALIHLLYCSLLCLLLIEVLLRNFRKVPFACSYLPGKHNPGALWSGVWLAFSIYAYVSTAVEVWALRTPGRLAVLFAFTLGAYVWLRRERMETWGEESLVFDEKVEPAVRTLGLGTE